MPMQALAPPSAPRVADLMAEARAIGVTRFDVQSLLMHHLSRQRAWLLAHDDHVVAAASAAAVRDGLARRAAGEPLAYVIGHTRFRNLRLQVSPAVLVPRPETEELVMWALEGLRQRPPPLTIADLGTGSGAVALAIAAAASPVAFAICATDASAAALEVAAANAQRLGFALELLQGDWWVPLAGRRFDLVVSNPPYIAAADPHLDALAHEPQGALTAGADGLDDLRTIIAGASGHLWPAGWLLLEHGHDQGPAVRSLLQAAGFDGIETRHDLAGLARCTRGMRGIGLDSGGVQRTQSAPTRA